MYFDDDEIVVQITHPANGSAKLKPGKGINVPDTDLPVSLDRLGAERIGLVLKIETQPAFERLPQILMTAMARPKVGVMIARGDLAVEVGYERMAELQEEILWLREAAPKSATPR